MIQKVIDAAVTEADVEQALRPAVAPSEKAKKELAAAKTDHRQRAFQRAGGILLTGVVTVSIGYSGMLTDAGWGIYVLLPGVLILAWGVGQAVGGVLAPVLGGGPSEDPETAHRVFLEAIFLRDPPDYAGGMRRLAPGILENTDFQTVSERWDSLRQAIRREVGEQETVQCSKCQQEHTGLWSVSAVEAQIPDEDWIREANPMLTCARCGAVFCGECFRHLGKRGVTRVRACHRCGEKMNKPTKLFLSDPDLGYRWKLVSAGKTEKMGGKALDLRTKVEMEFLLREPSMGPYHGSKKVELGSRGKVGCTFRNTAVKVEEGWFLVGAMPGKEVSAETDAVRE